jgi:hypothetical protein
MFWKSKDKNIEGSESSSSSREKSSKSPQEPTIDVGELENICYKKCIITLNTPILTPAEKSCLNRCANKFRESLIYGQNLLRNIDFKIQDINNNVALNLLQGSGNR